MKKIFLYLNLFLLSFSLSSCDLDTEPTTSVSEGLVFDNLTNVSYVLNGAWRYLWDGYTTYGAPAYHTHLLICDFIGNDIIEPGNYGYSGVYRLSQTTLTSSYHNWRVWFNAYYVINNMNEIITKIDHVTVQPGEEELVRQLKGQAYALRGWMYHSLIVFFNYSYKYDPQAKSIPIYTEPVTADTEAGARSTVAQVYARAQEDLETAYSLLDNYTRDQKYRIDRKVTAGLLARHHLAMENWKEAQQYAAEAHAGYDYMTTEQYHEGFNDLSSNPECMIGHANTTEQTSGTSYSFHYRDTHNSLSYYYSMMADPYFKDNYFDLEDGDTRNDLFEWSINRAAGFLMYKKFSFRVSEGRIADIILMRKSEMVLIEAEGYAGQGLLSQAVDKLLELRTARGSQTPDRSWYTGGTLSSLSQQELVEEILIERRKELWGEGFALLDIKRYQRGLERLKYPDSQILIPDADGNYYQYELAEGEEFDDFPNAIPIKGHITLTYDNKPFEPNASYLNPAYPDNETLYNPNWEKD